MARCTGTGRARCRPDLLANERLVRRMRSHEGHVVLRVRPGGTQFYIAVTDNASEADQVKSASEMFDT